MNVNGADVKVQQLLTREQKDYEEAIKNMKYMAAKVKMAQEGVNVQELSPEMLDSVVKILDEIDIINRDFNIEVQNIQQESNNKIRVLQEDANKKFREAQQKYKELIVSIMGGAHTTNNGIQEGRREDTVMTKEREEELRKLLADELKKSQKCDTST